MSPWARNLFSLLCYCCDTWPNKIQGRRINYGLWLKTVHHDDKVWWRDYKEVWKTWRWLFFMLSPFFLCVQYRSSNWYSVPFIPVRFHLASLERTHWNTIIWVFEVIPKQIKLILKITHHRKMIIPKLRFIEIRLSHKILLICFHRKSLK